MWDLSLRQPEVEQAAGSREQNVPGVEAQQACCELVNVGKQPLPTACPRDRLRSWDMVPATPAEKLSAGQEDLEAAALRLAACCFREQRGLRLLLRTGVSCCQLASACPDYLTNLLQQVAKGLRAPGHELRLKPRRDLLLQEASHAHKNQQRGAKRNLVPRGSRRCSGWWPDVLRPTEAIPVQALSDSAVVAGGLTASQSHLAGHLTRLYCHCSCSVQVAAAPRDQCLRTREKTRLASTAAGCARGQGAL